MNKDSVIDYCSYFLFKILGPIVRMLPLNFSLFLGRRLGDLFYYLDVKHKAVAYANIKTALGDNLGPAQLSRLTKSFYRAFGQNLIEIFIIPLIDKNYLAKYISIEGMEFISDGLKRGKGVILLGLHAGSWELSNIVCANAGVPFVLFVRNQRYPRLNNLLNSYRAQKNCKVIVRGTTKDLIHALGNNQAIGMSIDQGGRGGSLVEFFGKTASMSTGAVKLALKYGACIIPVFYTRRSGPYIRIILGPIFDLKENAGSQEGIRDNLQRLIRIFEGHIRKFPQEYLWTYKIWKYADHKDILILDDAKTGHTRQAQAAAAAVCAYLKEKGIKTKVDTVTVEFKRKFAKQVLTLSSCLAGKYRCQGCLWCIRTFLKDEVYRRLLGSKPDIVISCGSAIAPINYIISRENTAKSIVMLRPSILSMRRFDLVVMPRHDNPAKRKNVLVTEGALNLVSEGYLKEQSESLIRNVRLKPGNFYVGLLIGGDTKHFQLDKDMISEAIKQIKSVCEGINAEILVTTSRRTPKAMEDLIKKEFQNYPRCKLLIIANEKNIPEAVGGILGLSNIVVASPESISMVCEAVSSARYTVVFKARGLGIRHKHFLDYFAKNKYIYLTEGIELGSRIEDIWLKKPPIKILKDNLLLREAIEKIL